MAIEAQWVEAVAAAGAFVVALVALWISIRADRKSDDATTRSADALERLAAIEEDRSSPRPAILEVRASPVASGRRRIYVVNHGPGPVTIDSASLETKSGAVTGGVPSGQSITLAPGARHKLYNTVSVKMPARVWLLWADETSDHLERTFTTVED